MQLFPSSRARCDFKGPHVGPTEEAEPYVADSRWGRAVRQKWEEGTVEAYLLAEIERLGSFEFWVDTFIQCLPNKPEKERQRQDRTARRRQEKNKADKAKEGRASRRHRSTPKLSAFEDWLQAYSQDPFGGLPQLPLQTEVKEGRLVEKELVLLQQLEEENAFGTFRIRFHHLRNLSKGTHKRVFTGEAPELATPNSAGVDLQLPIKSSRGRSRLNGNEAGTSPGIMPLGLPELNPNSIKLPWWEIAHKFYLPAIQGGPQGVAMGRQFLEDLAEAFEALDGEMKLRAALESHQRLLHQQKAAAASVARDSASGSH
ncbi:hypothetical protein Efla_005710 [Eimeria flavescens]